MTPKDIIIGIIIFIIILIIGSMLGPQDNTVYISDGVETADYNYGY